jgi:hypothetical protein
MRTPAGAALAALFSCLISLLAPAPADAGPRRARVDLAPATIAGAMIDDRFAHLRVPEAYATARAWPRPSQTPERK